MVSYIRARVECEEYVPVLHDIKPKLKQLHNQINGSLFEKSLTKYLWTGNTVCNILGQLDNTEETEEVEEIVDPPLTSEPASHDVQVNSSVATDSVDRQSNSTTNSSDDANSRTTSVATAPSANGKTPPPPAPAKKSSSFFGSIFKSSSTKASCAPPVQRQTVIGNPEEESRRLSMIKDKEMEEARKADLRSLLHSVAASYRRCEAELSNCVVEV